MDLKAKARELKNALLANLDKAQSFQRYEHATALIESALREAQAAGRAECERAVVLERGTPFPVGLKPRFAVHIRLGFQWDHDPTDEEVEEFAAAAVEGTNEAIRTRAAAIREGK